MKFPVGPEDVKIVRGRSTGLQVVCSCGCINFNYLDPQDTTWECRNCRRILSYDFPRLLDAALAQKEAPAASEPQPAVSQKAEG